MSKDDIGDRAQWIANLLLTEFCGRTEPYFRARFLGDKHPTLDCIVELIDHPSCFFFVQVKGTSTGYTAKEARLKVRVSKQDIDRMVALPVPTYVLGVDTTKRAGFLVSVNESRGNIASLTTKFPVDCALLKDLEDEIVAFWKDRDMKLSNSRFKE